MKGAYLDPDDLGNLFKAVPRFKYLHDKIQEYSCWDFRCLQHPNFDWEAREVNEDRQKHREACLLHYNCLVEDVQRYCGWRFTGDHRRVEEML